ncbi:hypothetical protein CSUI_000254, partial [Cystoisospora suis]
MDTLSLNVQPVVAAEESDIALAELGARLLSAFHAFQHCEPEESWHRRLELQEAQRAFFEYSPDNVRDTASVLSPSPSSVHAKPGRSPIPATCSAGGIDACGSRVCTAAKRRGVSSSTRTSTTASSRSGTKSERDIPAAARRSRTQSGP